MRRDGTVEPDRGPHLEPNTIGLRIAQQAARPERTADPAILCGGDGGGMACGGAGLFLDWLPLATAFRDPDAPVPADESGDVLIRPALPLH